MDMLTDKKCSSCKEPMTINSRYTQKRFCSASCRAKVIPMPPRPDRTGSVPWNKGLTLLDDDRLRITSEQRRGKKNWRWAGGNSKTYKTSWGSAIHKAWRKTIFERDDYTCQICGRHGGTLNADHIKCFAHHKELRFEISNGRTLCEPCHKRTPNFGYHKKELCI